MRIELYNAFKAEASKGEMDLDIDAYRGAGRDPTDPVITGSGSLEAELGFFGRDPGRREVELGEPFIGAGGQLVRGVLFRALGGSGEPSLEESIEAGRRVFWANTCPYKPKGNKAWSVRVKRRFAPLVTELIVGDWVGNTLITLGNEAFFWFALAEPALRGSLEEYWSRDDRYEAELSVELGGKSIRLCPLPHPSPLNAKWHRRFPDLLARRLSALGWPA
jgi:uracil-DNA glycosylase